MNFFKKFNKLKTVKINYQKNLFLLIGFLGILCITVGGSYAYLTFQVTGDEVNYIQAGTLVVDFLDETTAITLDNAVPQIDGEALVNNNEHSFKVKNNGTIDASYTIKLKNVCVTTSNYQVGEASVKPDICIPINYIRVGIKDKTGVYTIKSATSGDIVLAQGELTSSAQFEEYGLKLWLSQDTPDDYQGQTDDGTKRNVLFVGKIEIQGSQLTS